MKKKIKKNSLSKLDKGSDLYWTSTTDNFLRYKKNGWNTDKKFSEEELTKKHKNFKEKYNKY